MQQPITSIFIGCLLLSITACQTTKPVRPLERYNDTNRFEETTSVITIPVVVNLRALEENLNDQLGEILYEDRDLEDGDKMEVVARKLDRIQLGVADTAVSYIVPLDLWIRYDLGLGKVEATGKVRLTFRTDYAIQPDWTLLTNSQLERYEWEEKPKVRLGGMGVPVGMMADQIIRRSEDKIGRLIDEEVASRFQLREQMTDIWSALHAPFQVSEEYQTWLLPNPEAVHMSPVRTTGRDLRTVLFVRSQPRLHFGAKPTAPSAALPPFQYQTTEQTEGFQIFLSAGLPYAEAERLTQQNLVGQRFEQGRRHVVVEDVELYGHGNNLVVNLGLSGSYEGEVYLTGEPVFNPRKNRIEIEDLTYDLSTKNVLLRSASWLIKGTLKQKIQENLDYLLEYNLSDAQRQLQETLNGYKPAPCIQLTGEMNAVDLYNAYLTTDGIQVVVALRGKLSVEINGLGQ